jgi:hypothetical protein
MVRSQRDEEAHASVAPERVTLAHFKDGSRRIVQVPWPGSSRLVGLLCPLTCAERQAAHFAAVDHFKKSVQPMDTLSSLPVFTDEKDRQELWLMLILPDSKRSTDRLFRSADDVRKGLDDEEVIYFQNCYSALNARRLVEMNLWPEGRDLPILPFKEQ